MSITDQITQRMEELKQEFAVEQQAIAEEGEKIKKSQQTIAQHTQNLIALQGEYKGLQRLVKQGESVGRKPKKQLTAKKK